LAQFVHVVSVGLVVGQLVVGSLLLGSLLIDGGADFLYDFAEFIALRLDLLSILC